MASKTNSRIRRWCFTLNNPTEAEIASLREAEPNSVKRLRVALEVGESGTPHIQGAIHFLNARTLSGVKRYLGSDRYHIEKMHGTDFEAFSYCSPDYEGKSPETCQILLEIGDMPIEGESDLGTWEQIIMAIDEGWSTEEIIRRWPSTALRCIKAIEQYRFELDWKSMGFRHITINYLSGTTGCGKTRYVMEKHGYHNVYRITNKQHPWDGYNGEPVVVFEEFRDSFRIEEMLNWLDGYPVRLPARYADKCAKYTEVWIISNWNFDMQYTYYQNRYPETYEAFKRRVHFVYDEDGLERLKAAERQKGRDEEE